MGPSDGGIYPVQIRIRSVYTDPYLTWVPPMESLFNQRPEPAKVLEILEAHGACVEEELPLEYVKALFERLLGYHDGSGSPSSVQESIEIPMEHEDVVRFARMSPDERLQMVVSDLSKAEIDQHYLALFGTMDTGKRPSSLPSPPPTRSAAMPP